MTNHTDPSKEIEKAGRNKKSFQSFIGKLKPSVVEASNLSKKMAKRKCRVIRESRDRQKYIVVWDGRISHAAIPKSFIRKVRQLPPTTSGDKGMNL